MVDEGLKGMYSINREWIRLLQNDGTEWVKAKTCRHCRTYVVFCFFGAIIESRSDRY